MSNSFNADFYATVATVIPVLYLAIAVQGSTFDAMLRWLYGTVIRKEGRLANLWESGRGPAWLRKIPRKLTTRVAGAFIAVVASTVVLVMAIALIVSLISEGIAVFALYDRQASSWQVLCVISIVALAVIIAAVPLWRLSSALRRILLMEIRDKRDWKRTNRIASKTLERPMTTADYRFLFSRMGTREHAERFAEELIADRVPPEELRLGGATEDDIRRALDEAFPLFDGSGDIARLREIAEKWRRANADQLDETVRRESQNRIREAIQEIKAREVASDDDDGQKDPP